MKKFTLMLLVVTFAFVLAFSGVALAGKSCSAGAKTTDATTVSANDGEKIAVLNVSNMTCGGCVSQITKVLKEVDGVSDVSVSLENGTAKVSYKADKVEDETLTAIIAVITKAGYPAKLSDGKMAGKGHAGCDPAKYGTKDGGMKGCGMKKAATTEATTEAKADDTK